MEILSVDKVLDSHSKKQKYLGLRVIVIALLIIFGLDALFGTKNIENVMVFNTLVLLFAPLFLEYLFGMDTYSNYTNAFRWIGLLISGFIVIVCWLGFMGKVGISFDDSEFIYELYLFNKLPILTLIKVLSYITIANTFFDYIFTFNNREKYYYSMIKDLEGFLEDKYQEYKEKGSLESRKEQFKKEILSNL